MQVLRFILLVLILGSAAMTRAANYYINAVEGNDTNPGTRSSKAWKSLLPLSAIQLKPGDSILFASGQHFSGMMVLDGIAGTKERPVVISSYASRTGPGRPVLDAGTALNAIWIRNSSFVVVRQLEITATTPIQTTAAPAKSEMRCGILVEITAGANYRDIVLEDIRVHDVYYHPQGFKRSAAEVKTANGTQSYGWGIPNTRFRYLHSI